MIIHKQRNSIGFIDDELRFLQLCKLIVMIVVVEEVLCPARSFVIRRNLIAELGPSLKLLWSMSSDGSTYTAMLKSSKPNVWISGGTADETSTSMVGNKVFLYAPTTARVLGFYAMKTHDANGFAKDASRTILSVQGTSEGSSLTVRGLSVFGHSYENFIWSIGPGNWSTQHAKGSYGFVLVYWSQVTCVASGSKLKEVSPAWVFLLLGGACACTQALFSPQQTLFGKTGDDTCFFNNLYT